MPSKFSASGVSLETPPPPPYTQVAGHVEKAIKGRLRLPEIDSPRTLALITRQSRAGVHWYHKEIHRIIKLRAWADDQELDYVTVPEHWVASGPGSPWLVFKLPIHSTSRSHGGSNRHEFEDTNRLAWLLQVPIGRKWRGACPNRNPAIPRVVEFLTSIGSNSKMRLSNTAT